MILDFEKFDNGRWYAVIPEWNGDMEDLEMVSGADTMLDAFSTDGFTARIEFVFEEDPADPSEYVRCPMIEHDDWGATYQPEHNDLYNGTFWLCNVTHFVCDEHPEVLWIKNLS